MIEKNYSLDNLQELSKVIDIIINEYTINKKGVEQIAHEYNLSYHTVRQVLIDNNIVMRQKNNRG